jgi:hypothetical protein
VRRPAEPQSGPRAVADGIAMCLGASVEADGL